MKIFAKIGLFFSNLFSKEFAFLKRNSGLAVAVTNTLKTIVESPLAAIAVDLIPGNVDNEVLAVLQKVVPKVAEEMAIAHGIIQIAGTNADVVAAIVKHLQQMQPGARLGFWLEFSGRLNYALADGKISVAEAVALAQMVYAEVHAN